MADTVTTVGFLILALLFVASIVFYGSGGTGSSSLDTNSSFLDLNDTPNSYSGQAGKVVQVNGTENGLQFSTVSGMDTNCSLNPNCKIVVNTGDQNLGSGVFSYGPTGGFIVGEKANNNCIRFYPNADGLGVTGGLLLPCVGSMDVGLNGVANFGSFNIDGYIARYNPGGTTQAPIVVAPGVSDQYAFEYGVENSQTGLGFFATRGSFGFDLGGGSLAQINVLGGPAVWQLLPSSGNPTTLSTGRLNGSGMFFKTFLDGNYPVYQNRPDGNFFGFKQSFYDQPYLFQKGDINVYQIFHPDSNLYFQGIDSNVIIQYKASGVDSNRLSFTNNDKNGGFIFNTTQNNGLRVNGALTIDGNGNLFANNLQISTGIGVANMQQDTNTNEILIRLSDQSLKSNIKDINQTIDTSLCYSLSPKTWIDNSSGKLGIGFIAQDVKAIFPQITFTIQDKNLMGIDELSFFSLCWEQAKKEHSDNLKQKEQIAIMTTQINLLKQIACPPGNINPLCQELNQNTIPN